MPNCIDCIKERKLKNKCICNSESRCRRCRHCIWCVDSEDNGRCIKTGDANHNKCKNLPKLPSGKQWKHPKYELEDVKIVYEDNNIFNNNIGIYKIFFIAIVFVLIIITMILIGYKSQKC